MKEFLEVIAKLRGWYFEYGRSDLHNLYDNDDEKCFKMFLDPIIEDENLNQFGALESTVYEGRFMLVMQSDLDGEYDTQQDTKPKDGKYQKHILPCKEELKKLRNELGCVYTIEQWKIMEVINVLDTNVEA